MADFPETDLFNRVNALNLPNDSLIMVGSGAIEAVVGPDVRRAQDIDLVVTEEVFQYMRNQPGMVEQLSPNGYHNLVGNGFDISTSWRGKDVEGLQAGGYVAKGVPIAGLPVVYAHKQERGTPKDLFDLATIQNRLYSKKTLPPEVIAGERRFVESCVPERLHGRPELEVAANGLYVVRTVFGDREETGAQTYKGEFEPGAVAIQHCWTHSAFGLRSGQRNIDKVEAQREREGLPPLFSDDDRGIAAAAYGNHDVILGHGRRPVNPERHDELQCADHVVSQLEAVGVTDEERLAKAHASVMVTTYNESTKSQDVDPRRGHVYMQELAGGEDFSIFRTPFAVSDSYNLSVENLTRIGGGYDQPLNKLVNELNARRPEGAPAILIRTPEEGLELIRQYPDYPATCLLGEKPKEITLMEALTGQLDGSAEFFEKYTPPGLWLDGDDHSPKENATRLRKGAAAIRSGELTPLESYNEQFSFEASLQHPAAVGGMPGARPEQSGLPGAAFRVTDNRSAHMSAGNAEDHGTEKGAASHANATHIEVMQTALREVDRLLSAGTLQEALTLLEGSAETFAQVALGAVHQDARQVPADLTVAKQAIREAEQAKNLAREALRRYRERL